LRDDVAVDVATSSCLLELLEIEVNAVVVADGTANKKNAVKLENLSLIGIYLYGVTMNSSSVAM
jgi:predicted transposase YbfD/YdcC